MENKPTYLYSAFLILHYPGLFRIANPETEKVKKEGCIEDKKNEEN